MPRYLISLTDANARKLEALLGGRVAIVGSYGPREEAEARGEAVISGLDAVFSFELDRVDERLRTSGPRYHHGGPERQRAVRRHAEEARPTAAPPAPGPADNSNGAGFRHLARALENSRARPREE